MNYGKDTSGKTAYNYEDVKKEIITSKDGKVPVLKGCLAASHGGCFCTGDCKEIVAWRDKEDGEV